MVKKPLTVSCNFIQRLGHACLGVSVILLLFPPLIILNVLQIISFITIRPFAQDPFRKISCGLANIWWGWSVSTAEKCGIEISFEGDDVPVEEDALVICNHQGMSDVVILLALAKQKKRLGNLKWFVKDVIKYFPGVGWGLWFLDTIFVKRDWFADKESIEATFRKITKYKLPAWVVAFPEGNRISAEKYAQCVEFAKAAGLKPLKHLLIPRPKGFVAQVVGLRGHLTGLYDVVIGYPDGVPTLWQFLQGMAVKVKVRVKRFNFSDLPSDEKALVKFLGERFLIKDEYMDRFKNDGVFIG